MGLSGCATGTNIGKYFGKNFNLAQIESRLPDEEALAQLMAYLIQEYFDTSNVRLMQELANNYTKYIVNNTAAAHYYHKNGHKSGKDHIEVSTRTKGFPEKLFLHEMLHDIWDNYLTQKQKDEFYKLTLTWHQKVMSPSFEGKGNTAASLLGREIIDTKNNYLYKYPNMDLNRLDKRVIGNETFAEVGAYLAIGHIWYVPPPFLKFYEGIIPKSKIIETREIFSSEWKWQTEWAEYELPLE